MNLTMIFQKRSALLAEDDAVFFCSGPFSKKTILSYILITNILNSLFSTLFLLFYVVIFSGALSIPTPVILALSLGSIVAIYAITVITDYFYLLEIASEKFRKIKRVLYAIILFIIVAIAGYYFIQADFQIQSTIDSMLDGQLFNFIPIFGWLRAGVLAIFSGDVTSAFINFGLLIGLSVIITILFISFKGDFYEKMLLDASWYSNLRRDAKAGKTTGNQKIRSVDKADFRPGAGAIYSRILLQLKKTNSWITIRDVALVLLYLAIAFFGQLGFQFYQFYILIIVFTMITSDFIVKELKIPYIYLIPDKPFKKLWNLILPTLVKAILLITVAITLGWFAFQVSILDYVTSLIMVIGYTFTLIASSIWCVKLLKSGTNAVAEQLIRLGIALLGIVPAIVISVILILMMPNDPNVLTYISLISFVTNLLVSVLLIYLARSLLNGRDIMAD